jgi:hypothetical protein
MSEASRKLGQLTFTSGFDEPTAALLRDVTASVLRDVDHKFPGKAALPAVYDGVVNALASLAGTGQRDREVLERYALYQASVVVTLIRQSPTL